MFIYSIENLESAESAKWCGVVNLLFYAAQRHLAVNCDLSQICPISNLASQSGRELSNHIRILTHQEQFLLLCDVENL